jgi:hypothetical protein
VAWGSGHNPQDMETTAVTSLAAGGGAGSSSPSSPTIHFKNSLETIFKYLSSKQSKSPIENILFELGNVRLDISRELAMYFNNPLVEEEMKRKRLTYLFVKDLLDGVNGMILDQKDQRDHYDALIPSVSIFSKVIASLILFVSAMGMLYYVFLFAMNQSTSRQTAWFSSFQLWLFFEIFIVSTGLVFVEHILLPLWCLRDIQRVKEKIVTDILLFQKKLKTKKRALISSSPVSSAAVVSGVLGRTSRGPLDLEDGKEDDSQQQQQSTVVKFNAAEYLYPSHRIASLYSHFQESQLILQYHTIWPKRSFQRGDTGGNGSGGGGGRGHKSIKKKYDKRFEFLTKTVTRVGIFSLTSVIRLPPSFQDLGIQVFLFTSFGYLLKLHLQLFEIHPSLVLFPFLCVGIVLYVMLSVGKKPRLLSETYPLALKEEEEREDEEEGKHGDRTKQVQVLSLPSRSLHLPQDLQQDSSDRDSLSVPEDECRLPMTVRSYSSRRGGQSHHDLMLAQEFFSKLDSERFKGNLESEEEEEMSFNSFQIPTNGSSSSTSSSSASQREGQMIRWESSSECSGSHSEESRSIDSISWRVL